MSVPTRKRLATAPGCAIRPPIVPRSLVNVSVYSCWELRSSFSQRALLKMTFLFPKGGIC